MILVHPWLGLSKNARINIDMAKDAGTRT